MDVWKNTTLSDGDSAQKLVQLLVVAHSELHVARDDAGLLVVASGVSCQLEDFSSQVLEDSREVHWSTSTDTGGVSALLEVSANTTDRELKSRLGGSAHGLLVGLASSTFSFA